MFHTPQVVASSKNVKINHDAIAKLSEQIAAKGAAKVLESHFFVKTISSGINNDTHKRTDAPYKFNIHTYIHTCRTLHGISTRIFTTVEI